MRAGADAHRVDGAPVRVSDIARTVADCFKYRSKIGLEVALKALKEALKEQGQGRLGTAGGH